MRTITSDELAKHALDILSQLQKSGDIIEITEDGEVVARLIPARRPRSTQQNGSPAEVRLDDLAARIGSYLPEKVDAVEAIREIRREL